MEDLKQPDTPTASKVAEPEALADPNDPLRPEIDEENAAGTPPIADPYADMEVQMDEMPKTDSDSANEAMADDDAEHEDGNPANTDPSVKGDDEDSELEELDEREFDDFDATALTLPDKPLLVDESNVALLGVHKRKRTAEEEAERERKKKRKEKKREKPSRKKKSGDEDDFEGGQEMDGKRVRKSKMGGDGKSKAARREKTPENEENLTPDERESKGRAVTNDEC